MYAYWEKWYALCLLRRTDIGRTEIRSFGLAQRKRYEVLLSPILSDIRNNLILTVGWESYSLAYMNKKSDILIYISPQAHFKWFPASARLFFWNGKCYNKCIYFVAKAIILYEIPNYSDYKLS
jgi:hypothetical protein